LEEGTTVEGCEIAHTVVGPHAVLEGSTVRDSIIGAHARITRSAGSFLVTDHSVVAGE
jgi:hypothetical protein